MAFIDYQFVDYEQYCKWCVHHKEDDEYGSVCHTCLLSPAREGSHIPINFSLNPDYKPNAWERTLSLFKEYEK